MIKRLARLCESVGLDSESVYTAWKLQKHKFTLKESERYYWYVDYDTGYAFIVGVNDKYGIPEFKHSAFVNKSIGGDTLNEFVKDYCYYYNRYKLATC